MPDKDRGTYSPPTEDNLSYEARRPAGRDQAPITLIISGIFLVLLLLAVVLFYNSGLNNHGGRTPPEVGDSLGDIKDAKVEDAKPLSDAQLAEPTDDSAANAKFAPGTEAPLRDQSASAGVTNEAPPVAAPITGPLPSQTGNSAITGQGTAAAAASPAAAVAPLKPPVQTVAPATSGTVATSAPAKLLPPVKVAPAAKPAAVASASASAMPTKASGSMVQIGAFDSTDKANTQYANVASSYGLFLSGTSKRIEKVETDKGTFYRTSFAGFSTPEKARSFCSALKAAGHDCIVK